jgi:thiol-disulfide isomerase/thioredoxin
MDNSHPVLFIHTAPWCPTCKNIVKPENWNILTDTINSINPNTEIRLIQHAHYQQLNKDPSKIYPRVIKAVHVFPSFVVQPSTYATKEGSMEKSIIFKGYFDTSIGAIVEDKESKDENIKDWLASALLSVSDNNQKEEQKKINSELMKRLTIQNEKKPINNNSSNSNSNSSSGSNNYNRSSESSLSVNKLNQKKYAENEKFIKVYYRKPF